MEVVLIKDVEGVYTSDPDKVRNPQFIKSLNGEEAEMLAAGGAKFLHVKALRYQASGLRLRVTSLEKLNEGTVIKGDLAPVSLEVFPQGVSMITVVGLRREEARVGLRADPRGPGGRRIAPGAVSRVDVCDILCGGREERAGPGPPRAGE